MSETSQLLPAHWQVPQEFRDRLGNSAGRQRIMEAQGHLLIVLHEPPKAEEIERRGRLFWRDPQGHWMPKGLHHGEHALAELIAGYERAIDRLDEREEVAESEEEYFDILKDLSPLIRAANNLHNTMQKAREAVPEDRQLLVLRDAAYAMARRIELLSADTRHALEYRIAMRAEEQAESSRRMATSAHRLNLLVAFFFPLATIAGVFGMNLHNPLYELSERSSMLVILAILGVGVVLGAILTAFVTLPPRPRAARRPQAARKQ